VVREHSAIAAQADGRIIKFAYLFGRTQPFGAAAGIGRTRMPAHCASGGANTAERNGAAAVDVPPVTGLRRVVLRSGENRRVVDL
jgi:hypothetical protein